MMQSTHVVEKIQSLPEPLLREVDDFVDFLLARYQLEATPVDEYPAALMSRLSAAGGAFEWLNDPTTEDIYSDADGKLYEPADTTG